MTDPFDALRLPHDPVEPDPTFADRLRVRLTRALDLPKGVTVSGLALDQTNLPRSGDAAPAPIRGRAEITPYLCVSGAAEAISWYGEALGARTTGDPVVMPDGRIGHAELDIAGARLMLSEEHPEIGVVAPAADAGAAVTLHLSVADVDEVVQRCLAAGATLEREPLDYDYGRHGVVRDPYGHRWLISSEPGRVEATAIRHGDIGYVSLQVPDVGRAAAFFRAVLQWEYEPDDRPQARRIAGLRLHHGMWGGVAEPTLFCCYAVDDADGAALRIAEAGGTASAAHDEPYGRVVDATDPEGTPFAVYMPPEGIPVGGGGGPDGRPRQGDVVYVTMEVTDSARIRDFYGHVLGWRTTPGRVPDGWNVEGVAPMVGIAGGRPSARNVPMYRVDDVDAAVARVRAAGGTATDPAVQPYGVTSDATDDQGTRFYLGQL